MAAAPDTTSKVVLVTGATSGIGLATARALARGGATVAMVGRSPGREEDAHREVLAAAGSAERVELFTADLSSLSDVRRLAADVQSRFDRLDVLFDNAGCSPTSWLIGWPAPVSPRTASIPGSAGAHRSVDVAQGVPVHRGRALAVHGLATAWGGDRGVGGLFAELATTTGAYFKRGNQMRSSEASYDVDLAGRLWEATEALLEGESP